MAREKKAAPKSDSRNGIICQLIKIAGEKHLLEKMWAKKDFPEIKAVGYMKLGPERHSWVSYTITTKGDKVIKIDINEPNLRDIAEESAKIAFVESLMSEADQA